MEQMMLQKAACITLVSFLMAGTAALPAITFAASPEAGLMLKSKNRVVLPSSVKQLEQQASQSQSAADQVTLAQAYLQLARQPGWSRYFDKAQQLLKKAHNPSSAAYWLALADTSQQQHQFEDALNYLAKAQQLKPDYINALLMKNRIYLVQNNTAAALAECKKLLGQQELFLLSLCSLEVAGRQGKTQDSYKALQLLARQQQSIPLAQQQWLIAVLAEQAEALHQPKQARAWLEQLLFAAQSELAPLPLWVKWADLTLKQDAALVYQKLQYLQQHQQLEDALLLRLALAEQQLGKGQEYQLLMQQRVSLREQRQDTLHSADLAHYYLRLAPDPKKALYYARLNVQQAQEPDDQLLFTLALAQSQQDNARSVQTGEQP
ncbi:MAG TPA: hypothetical protein VJ795_00345 [Rheinheimera sp.]|uniref:tetratricopeptide repeat protein n=1 Tax=Rheinheimera sp. TaxID=1869214 RepID=UPI002B4A8315|nr:hypothetical protein [Rheinheimera sp.]HJS13494.1 hypothetical protein [Rheinheimera sp.]